MIPPNNYLTFIHHFSGSFYYKGTGNYEELYSNFLENPENNTCEYFSNILSNEQIEILKMGFLCIVLVIPTEKIWGGLSKVYRDKINKIVKHMEEIIKTKPINLIGAWDVEFDEVDHKINNNNCAIIIIESIMKVPLDGTHMYPGNIFILNYGKVIFSNLDIDEVFSVLDTIIYIK